VRLLIATYSGFLDRRGRVSLRSLFLFAIAYVCVYVSLITLWRAVFGFQLPSLLKLGLGSLPVIFWLSPLVVWLGRALRTDGLLRYQDLNATPAIVLSWGILVATILPYDSVVGRNPLADHFGVAIATGLVLYGGLRLLSGVPVIHFAIGLGVMVAITALASLSDGRMVARLHEEHLQGHLLGVRHGQIVAASIIGAVAAGAIAIMASPRVGRVTKALLRAFGRWSGPAATSSIVDSIVEQKMRPRPPAETTSRPSRAAFGAQRFLKKAERELEIKRAAVEAEEALSDVLEGLKPSGWRVELSLWLKGERIGDVDAFAQAPSGARYAIDAKSHNSSCVIEYDEHSADLVAVYSDERHSTKYLAKAREQVAALKRRGLGDVQPVLCFTRAIVGCPEYISGVAIVKLVGLTAFLTSREPVRPAINESSATNIVARND
jgi:hypothetical protein